MRSLKFHKEMGPNFFHGFKFRIITNWIRYDEVIPGLYSSGEKKTVLKVMRFIFEMEKICFW